MIVCSGRHDASELVGDLPVAALLRKPVDIEVLIAAVREATGAIPPSP